VVLTVLDTSGSPVAGLNAYAFNGTTYTGISGLTDAARQVTFTLSAGSYRFRADRNGTQFWSGSGNHCTTPGCETAVVVSGKLDTTYLYGLGALAELTDDWAYTLNNSIKTRPLSITNSFSTICI
jgi:hypothetical protein